MFEHSAHLNPITQLGRLHESAPHYGLLECKTKSEDTQKGNRPNKGKKKIEFGWQAIRNAIEHR